MNGLHVILIWISNVGSQIGILVISNDNLSVLSLNYFANLKMIIISSSGYYFDFENLKLILDSGTIQQVECVQS